MSSREFAEWMAYDCVEPIGAARLDILTALLASVIANANGGKKDGGAFGVQDFLPSWAQPEPDPDLVEEERQQGQQRLMAWAEMLTKATGGKDERKGG